MVAGCLAGLLRKFALGARRSGRQITRPLLSEPPAAANQLNGSTPDKVHKTARNQPHHASWIYGVMGCGSTRAGKRPDAVECDGRAQGASLLSTHRLAYCPYGLACFSARPARKTSCWTSALRRASQHDRSKEAGCGKHNARAGLNLFVFNRSARGTSK